MKFSPYGTHIPLVFVGKSHREILLFPKQSKKSHFLALNINISKIVADMSKVTIND